MKATPTIQKYMTTTPHTIGLEQNLIKAEEMMRSYKIQHLPVLHGGKLIGILSDRDVKFIQGFRDVDPEKVTVEEALTPDPYITKPDAKLEEVCAEMALHHYGCAIVCDNNKVVGIFTWIDALKAFDQLLSTRLKH